MQRSFAAFDVIESLQETGKAHPADREDRLFINPHFVAVIDGATSSGPIDGVAGGIVAAEAVYDALAVLPANASARAFVDAASAELAARIGPWPDKKIARPAASVVVWSVAQGEIWRIGDCHFRLDANAYCGDKPIDRLAYEYRCAVLRGRLALGLTTVEAEKTVPTLEQPFMELVGVQHAFANVDIDDSLNYGAIDGALVPDRFIERYPIRSARDIVLCSDGFTRPHATLREGLAANAELKSADPLMIRHYHGSRPFPPGSAFFDDATYVRLRVRRD